VPGISTAAACQRRVHRCCFETVTLSDKGLSCPAKAYQVDLLITTCRPSEVLAASLAMMHATSACTPHRVGRSRSRLTFTRGMRSLAMEKVRLVRSAMSVVQQVRVVPVV
jgi:hypothetical protein